MANCGNPSFTADRAGTLYEPIATEAQLFADNLACHWAHTMHIYQLTDKPLEKADIVRILQIFIPN
jgi:hypothetical protein